MTARFPSPCATPGRPPIRLGVILLLPLALTACDPGLLDTSRATGPWAPQGLNAANLAAMVQNPADLTHGHGDGGPDRKLAAHAVTDLWAAPSATARLAGSSGGGSGKSGGSSGADGGSGSSGSGGGGSGASGSGGGGSGGSGASAGTGN